jgi:hypothetical protein
MKMLRTQAIEDGAIPANDNEAKPVSGLSAFINMVKERAGTSVEQLIADRSKDRFQVTWFDDVDQSTAKEEIVQGVLGAGEFSLFVAKPGMGKSVLVGDIGCHIAAGMETFLLVPFSPRARG